MKKGISTAAAAFLALSTISANANAASLENAIKGIEVSGYLDYEYAGTKIKEKRPDGSTKKYHQDNLDDPDDPNNAGAGSSHTWHSEIDFKIPASENLALNFGVAYENGSISDSGYIGENGGLGSGADGGGSQANDGFFGNSIFNAIYSVDSIKTDITAGKMRLETPFNDAEYDRGIGALLTNTAVSNWTFALGAYDTWAIDDDGDNTYNNGVYLGAAMANYEMPFGNIEARLWAYTMQNAVDFGAFAEVAFDNSLINAKAQYLLANAKDGKSSIYADRADPTSDPKLEKKSDLATFTLGFDGAEKLKLPLSLNVNYTGNFGKNYAVSWDDEGEIELFGNLWYADKFTILNPSEKGIERKVSAFAGNIGYSILDNLKAEITYVSGEWKEKTSAATAKTKFQEITPKITYDYNDRLSAEIYYAMLEEKPKGDGSELRSKFNTSEFDVKIRYTF